MKSFYSPRFYRTFCLLLVAIFALKALAYLAIIPPFEGWDEYQHLSYITYISEHDQRPVLNHASVPTSLLKKVVHYPVPQDMLNQILGSGAVTYKTFFQPNFHGTTYNSNFHNVNLYEAQQGSLYYRLMEPLVRYSGTSGNLLHEVFLLRLINALMALASIAIIVWLVFQLVEDKRHAAFLSLLIASQPLFLINSLRVANDSLAVFTATVVIAIGMLPKYRSKFFCALIAGGMIGLSCWAKSTTAILFPFWGCCLLVSWYKKEISLKRMIGYLVVSNAVALLILGNYFEFNLKHYGMLFVMQEAIVNHHNHKSWADFITTLHNFPVIRDLLWMWTKGSIWTGGWSFLKVGLTDLPMYMAVFSLAGWIFALFKRVDGKAVLAKHNALLLFILFLTESMALCWHYIQSATAWGHPTTCPWYIGVCMPFFLIFVYDSASRWSERVASGIGILFFLLYVSADLRGTLKMVGFYSGGAGGGEALRRLASLHPVWLGTPTLLVSSLLYLVLLVVATGAVLMIYNCKSLHSGIKRINYPG
jgi:hypothetical protein